MLDYSFEDIKPITDFLIEFYENWLSKVTALEQKEMGDITLIFCSDEYLLNVNREYLDHDYYTDIITFDYTEDNIVSGDLFISLDRVADNAQIHTVDFINELNRVVVHGVLHLCGYKDKSEEDEKLMRSKENQMLQLL